MRLISIFFHNNIIYHSVVCKHTTPPIDHQPPPTPNACAGILSLSLSLPWCCCSPVICTHLYCCCVGETKKEPVRMVFEIELNVYFYIYSGINKGRQKNLLILCCVNFSVSLSRLLYVCVAVAKIERERHRQFENYAQLVNNEEGDVNIIKSTNKFQMQPQKREKKNTFSLLSISSFFAPSVFQCISLSVLFIFYSFGFRIGHKVPLHLNMCTHSYNLCTITTEQ